MISNEAALLTLSLAQGAFKLAGRMDRLMAEKDAVTGKMILPMPSLTAGPGGRQMVKTLEAYLQSTAGRKPDPLGADRERIEAAVSGREPDPVEVEKWFKRHFPEQAVRRTVRPDSAFFKALQKELPSVDWQNEGNRLSAFYIAAGKDDAELSYTWRLALLVTDVLAEFGAENAALIFDDRRARPLVASVLQRFSRPDLEDFTAWSPLLRHMLGATLNGLLDVRDAWQGEDPWVNALLNALSTTREAAGDDYLLGLIRGDGYRILIAEGLSEASRVLGAADASEFERIAADVLIGAVPLVKANRGNFRHFFQDHWGNLLRAGLRSFERYGPAVLADESALLRDTLLAVVSELGRTGDKELLSRDMLLQLADAAIGAVARNPGLITEDIHPPWLQQLVTALTQTVGEQGIRRTFSKEGLADLVEESLQVFAEHPELIVREPGLLQKLVGGVLTNLTPLARLDAERIATASVEGALAVIAANPGLLDTQYPDLVADFAGRLGAVVSADRLDGLQAAAIAAAAVDSVTLNPDLFLKTENRINTAVLDALTRVAGDRPGGLLAGAVLVGSARELMTAMARHGQQLLGDRQLETLAARLYDLVDAALVRAASEIGRGMALPSLPALLGRLVAAAARGELAVLDPDDVLFKKVFAELSRIASG
jgi:hypothetical protein